MNQNQNIQAASLVIHEEPSEKENEGNNHTQKDDQVPIESIPLTTQVQIIVPHEKSNQQQTHTQEKNPNQTNIQEKTHVKQSINNKNESIQLTTQIETNSNPQNQASNLDQSHKNNQNHKEKTPQKVQQGIIFIQQPLIAQDEQCRLFINQKSKQQDSTPDKNQMKQVQFQEVVLIAQQHTQQRSRKTFTQILLQKKQRLEERYKKSQKIRATIIKLEPIATKKDSQIKIALNTLKMTQTAQFLQSKGVQNAQQRPHPSQWTQQRDLKHQRIRNLIQNTSSPKKNSPQMPKYTGISPSKSKKDKSPSKEKKSPSLPKIQSRPFMEKIMPYNIYNLYQRKQQVFKLSSLATP